MREEPLINIPTMQHVSPTSLSDLPSRIAYLSSFLDLKALDGEALHAAKPLIAPLIPTILDAVYEKLLSFDITAQAFVLKGTDYEGETVKNVQELTMEHPQIVMRKDFLKVRLPKSKSKSSLFPFDRETTAPTRPNEVEADEPRTILSSSSRLLIYRPVLPSGFT